MSSKPLVPSFWEDATMVDLFAHAAERYGTAPALVYDGTAIGFRELQDRVHDCAAGLQAAGVDAGDRVAVLAEDRPEWFEAVFGTAVLGAVPVFLPVHYSPREIHHAITVSDAETLIAQDTTAEGNILDRYAPLFFDEGSTDDESVVIEDTVNDQLERVYTIDRSREYDGSEPFDSLVDASGSTVPSGDRLDAVEPENATAILFTSGTTSMPKAVVRTHRNLLPHAVDMGEWYERSAGDRLLDLFPNPSITGTNQLLMSVAHGCTYHLVDHYDADRALSVASDYPLACVSGVDTMFRDLLEHPRMTDLDVSPVDRIVLALTGGVDPDLSRRAERAFDAPMENPYGMSEINAYTLRSKPDDPFEVRMQPGGRPGYKTGVIVDTGAGEAAEEEEEREECMGTETETESDGVPDHLVGEICVKGITVTPGYDDNERATERAFDDEGWFHTDDTGSLQVVDGTHVFYFSGRLDDMFQVGGNNVSPSEIETVIVEMDGVSWAGVVGIPHDRMGTVPAAFVTLEDGEDTIEAEDVTAYCEARVAKYKVPRTVFVIEPAEIPTEAGVNGKKLRRDRLRDRALEERA